MLAVGSTPAVAQTREALPEGIPIGHWIVAPFFASELTFDDNLFRSPDGNLQEEDRLTALEAGLVATLPFRNSRLNLEYEASRFEYAENAFTRDTTQDFKLDLAFNFSSGDTLEVQEQYTKGFSDLRVFDEGGQLEFEGQPFNYNQVDLRMSRSVRRQQGYSIRVSRRDLNFVGDNEVPFFDYRGFDSSFEFRQPLAGAKWLIAYYGSRRFNHYEANTPEEVGNPIRKETTDSLQLGLRGFLGPEQPFVVRLGYTDFAYEGTDSLGFNGLVGFTRWLLRFGASSELDLSFSRRPLPSNFDTFYLINEFRSRFSRDILRNGSLGIEFLAAKNKYGAPVGLGGTVGEERVDCGAGFSKGFEDFIRKDERFRLRASLGWRIHPRMRFELSAAQSKRSSNCAISEYDATVVRGNLSVGWF